MENLIDNLEPITVPHSPTTEEALLGALIIDPQRIRMMAIDPDDFYIIRNRMVFLALDALSREGSEVDYITLCGRLDANHQLAEIGGPARITSLLTGQISALSADDYARILKEKARRRKLIDASNELARAAYNTTADLDEAVSLVMNVLARSVTLNKGLQPLSSVMTKVYDRVMAAMQNPQDIYGIPTGLFDWDRETHGLQKGTVIKVSGEPGIGKSLLTAQVLAHAAKHGHPGALFQLEMGGEQTGLRLLSAEAKITTAAMRSGRLSEDQATQFTAAIETLSALPVYMTADQMTTQEVRAELHRAIDQYGIELAVIDYEGLLSDMPDADDNVRSKAISSRVHAIAKDLNLALLVIDDMNKEGISGRMKGKGGLAGSARKLHDADEIIILRKSEENPDIVLMTWEKNREGGATGCVALLKSKFYPMFGNMTGRLP